MPINQPTIGESQADNSWKLEATEQLNREEARVNALAAQITQLEQRMAAATTGFNPNSYISSSFDNTSTINSLRGNLVFGKQDSTLAPDRLDLASAIANISAITTGTIKAQTFSTTDKEINQLPRTTGSIPTSTERLPVFDVNRNPATSFTDGTTALGIAASALPPRSSWIVSAFTSDNLSLRTEQLYFIGIMLRPGLFLAPSIIVPLARNGLQIQVFGNNVPEIFIESSAAGNATRDIIIDTFAITNESGILRQ